jgi:phenylalanine ammonia-lyase
MIRALCGHEDPFEPFVHECKPHPGQLFAARTLLHLLKQDSVDDDEISRDQFQDRYSIRCLPQYFGPIIEGIVRLRRVIETEMNAITDNPLVDAEGGCFYQSGNFLGQYISVAMDELRGHLSLLAKHLDVQIAQLVSPEFSHGLPASLHGNSARSYNMGLKGLQITGNSIVPMLTHHASPLVQHYPTHAEQYNQNINGLSWGSANLAWRCVELFQHYGAVASIFAVQAIDLRSFEALGHYDGRSLLGPLGVQLYEAIYRVLDAIPGAKRPLVFNDSDQSLESYVEHLAGSLRDAGPIIQAVAPIVESLDAADF